MLGSAACEARDVPSQRVFLCLVHRESHGSDPVRLVCAAVCRKEGSLEAPREQLLQDLIRHEKNVAAKVDEARAEAERIILQARSEARERIEGAKSKAEEDAKSLAESAERESQEARGRIVAEADAAITHLKAQAETHRARAVAAVLEQVLP